MTTRTLLFLGGTFDPVHIGHARLALEAHGSIRADRTFFVPCHIPPHKPEPTVSTEHRLNMLTLVIEEMNAEAARHSFGIETCELARAGASYTVDTLRFLRERYAQERLFWLIGMDSLLDLPRWHQWKRLTEHANLLVVGRPGFALPSQGELVSWLTDRKCPLQSCGAAGNIALLETTPLSVSSTAVRTLIQQGTSPLYLLSKPVQAYIRNHHLYSEQKP